jgi:tetratricopeptide (TPR) repeat protein
MDKSTFEKLILSDFEISPLEAILLEDLLEAFPYCQSAHLLIAKDSQQKKSMLYPKKLRKASTYILNRKVLQHYLTERNNTSTIASEINIPQQNTLIEEIENTIREIKANREQVSILLETDKKKEEKTIPNNVTINNRIFTSESRLGDEIAQSESKSSIELFISYLNHENSVVKQNSILNQDEVINKFIETEPKITRSIVNTFIEDSAQDLSSTSTELKVELVTENYALILLKQNKIEKAKEIYKKLILKYPNKSAYFEAKLNEI